MRNFVFFMVVILLARCTSLTLPPIKATQEETCQAMSLFFDRDLRDYQLELDAAGQAYQDEQWKMETADPLASQDRMTKAYAELQKVTYNEMILDAGKAWKATKAECPMSRQLKRATGLLETTILTNPKVIAKEAENQSKQDALSLKNNGFRLDLPGEKEPVSRAIYLKKLGSTPDRTERRELYTKFNGDRAAKWLEWDFRGLLEGRNEEARLAGFPNYYAYRFYRNQLDLENYRGLVKQVRTKLAPKVQKLMKSWGKKEKLAKLEPWDMRYLREKASTGQINTLLTDLDEKAPLDMAKRFYGYLGLNVDQYGFTMDLFPRDGKNTHAFAMAVVFPQVDDRGRLLAEPKPDIRFLANLKKPVKWDDLSTVIHELGHAIHAGEVRQRIDYFRSIGSVETEAIAMLLERLARHPDLAKPLLTAQTKTDADKVDNILKLYAEASRQEQAITLLRQIFFSDFEYEMYQNPKADFGALWSKMHQDYWGIAMDPKEADWDIDHFVMAPVYVQNYALAILLVEQWYHSLVQDFENGLNDTRVGDKLKLVLFAPGVEYDYLDMALRFTTKPLSADAALKLLP